MSLDRYTSPEMGAIWSAQAKVDAWLKVELAVAEAWTLHGEIPHEAMEALRSATIDLKRMDELEAQTDHDVIAFIRAVGETVPSSAARWIHLGLTSSDVVDTGLAIQARDACDLLLENITALDLVLVELAVYHKDTLTIGRSHGVFAEPTTFGLKMAGWLAELRRGKGRLEAAREDIATGKISGAVGTHANVPPEIELQVCDMLGLEVDPVSTQIVARDRHAALMSVLALLATSIERWATEIRLLARTEVREAEEPFSSTQQGSSAMPHKRNPHKSERLTGLARVVRGYAVTALENVALWHERDISHSAAERVIFPGAFIIVDFMLRHFTFIARNMAVYPARMKKNIDSSGGLIFSERVMLAMVERGMDRQAAYKIVQRHARAVADADTQGETGPTFVERLSDDPEVAALLKPEEITALIDYSYHLRHIDEAYRRLGLL